MTSSNCLAQREARDNRLPALDLFRDNSNLLGDNRLSQPGGCDLLEQGAAAREVVHLVGVRLSHFLARVVRQLPLAHQEEPAREREFFIDNLLVRIHSIIEMIVVDRPCAMGI